LRRSVFSFYDATTTNKLYTMARRGKSRSNRKRNREEIAQEHTQKEVVLRARCFWWNETNQDEFSVEPDVHNDRTQQAFDSLALHFSWPRPTPIQSSLWPLFPNKTSAIALGPTGGGKTLAFGLPLLLSVDSSSSSAIFVPTRELAIQVARNLNEWKSVLTKQKVSLQVTSVLACHGGAVGGHKTKEEQIKMLGSQQVVMVAATPGRFLDLLQSMGGIPPTIRTVVLDEADRLASQTDLCQQMDAILAILKPDKLCLSTATMPEKAKAKWAEWIGTDNKCALVRVDSIGIDANKDEQNEEDVVQEDELVNLELGTKCPAASIASAAQKTAIALQNRSASEADACKTDWLSRIPSNLTQVLHVCSEHKKPKKLLSTLAKIRGTTNQNESGRKSAGLGIIFFNKIKTAQFVAKMLAKEKIPCLELHSRMNQTQRESAVRVFASGRIPLLNATDICARGIHVDNVRFVIQYDMASNLEQFVHRCGRAGRGDEPATIYSFFTRNLAPLAGDMVRLLRANNQMVDPNLLELVQDNNDTNKGKRQRTSGKDLSTGQYPVGEDASSDDESFSDLAGAQRIVLKRAGYISDASADSSTAATANED
jgi:ATP-dependent RNA helicase DDX5/DBP2